MYSMVARWLRTAYFKVSESQSKKFSSQEKIHKVIDVNQTYGGERFQMYTKIKPLVAQLKLIQYYMLIIS